MATQKQIETHAYGKMILVITSLAFVFGIVWVILGDSNAKLIYAPVAFAVFLYALITAEKSGIALNDAH